MPVHSNGKKSQIFPTVWEQTTCIEENAKIKNFEKLEIVPSYPFSLQLEVASLEQYGLVPAMLFEFLWLFFRPIYSSLRRVGQADPAACISCNGVT